MIMGDSQNWLKLKGGSGRLFEWWAFTTQLPRAQSSESDEVEY